MNTDSPPQSSDRSKSGLRNQFAFLSAKSRSAIATIWICGDQADAALDRYFHSASNKRAKEIPIGKIAFGNWRSLSADGLHARESQEPVDSATAAIGEEVVICRVKANEVEVHCHGGVAAQQAIYRDLSALGFDETSWSEWERAQAGNLITAEAAASLRCAITDRTAGILLDQLNGSLTREIALCRTALAANGSRQAQEIQEIVDRLLSYATLGAHLVTPFQIVIAGPPNVGKSSLINCLLGYQRAIVLDQPGTTRDVVTCRTALDGWPVELSDTAGIREGENEIEVEGVRRAMHTARKADLLVLVFDRSAEWTEAEQKLLDEHSAALLVFNKCDKPAANQPSAQTMQRIEAERGAIQTIAVERRGIAELIEAMVRRLVPVAPEPGLAVPFTDRQVRLLQQATNALTANDQEMAAVTLREI